MKDEINRVLTEALERIGQARSIKDMEELRVDIFGKKGVMTQILKGMGAIPQEDRPAMGQLANDARAAIEAQLETAANDLKRQDMERRLSAEAIDVTLPGKIPSAGGRHPMTLVTEDLCRTFLGLGFVIAEGPEIETDYHNFVALNTPAHHPARDEQDTFYMDGDGGFLLRTHTSPVQVRVMESQQPPIRVICPGKVYRSDDVDALHSPVFHQMEGLVVDRDVTLGDLKGTLTVFAKELFGNSVKVRFRPHFFPFTEPSGEMDVSCFACGGAGCRVCKGDGWIELLGCGMVHPKVLAMSGIDPAVYSGFAFGMGLDRVAMQRYGITDMRLLFENDVRFLKQFA